jgi:hypothetical protein
MGLRGLGPARDDPARPVRRFDDFVRELAQFNRRHTGA